MAWHGMVLHVMSGHGMVGCLWYGFMYQVPRRKYLWFLNVFLVFPMVSLWVSEGFWMSLYLFCRFLYVV